MLHVDSWELLPDQAAEQELAGVDVASSMAGAPQLSAAELEAEISALVHGYVGDKVDPTAPLAVQGLDSLAAMELRQKLQVPPEQALAHASH